MLPGRQTVKFEYANSPVEPNSSEVIVFLNEDKSWEFVAEPLHDRKEVAGSVLAMRGFFDFNAHFVGPGLITLDMLKKYLKDQVLEYRFRGQVYFPLQVKTEWAASTVTIQGTYDVVKEISDVRGLPDLKGFPEQPDVHVMSIYSRGNLDLIYSRSLKRQLEIMGLPQGVDPKTGEIIVHFAIKAPEFLSESALRDYLSDESKGGYWSSFKLPVVNEGVEKDRILYLDLGKSTATKWDTMKLVGWDKEPIEILEIARCGPGDNSSRGGQFYSGPSIMPRIVQKELDLHDGVFRLVTKAASGEFVMIAIEYEGPREPAGPFVWSFQEVLPNLLYTRKTKGKVFVTEGQILKSVGTFTPVFEKMGFNKND